MSRSPFPIDVVITWVDSTDPKWIMRYEQVNNKKHVHSARWTPKNKKPDEELSFCLWCIKKNMPWVRNVYIVTQNQVPSCVKNEIIVDHSALGLGYVFNSHAIETSIHNIPGLSEHFVYFNDDVYVIKEVDWSLFFDGDGTMIVHKSFNRCKTDWEKSIQQTLLKYGANQKYVLAHTPHSMTQSVMRAAEKYDPIAWDQTRKCRLRHECGEIAPVPAASQLAILNGEARFDNLRKLRYKYYHDIPSFVPPWSTFPHVVCVNEIEGNSLLLYKVFNYENFKIKRSMFYMAIIIVAIACGYILIFKFLKLNGGGYLRRLRKLF